MGFSVRCDVLRYRLVVLILPNCDVEELAESREEAVGCKLRIGAEGHHRPEPVLDTLPQRATGAGFDADGSIDAGDSGVVQKNLLARGDLATHGARLISEIDPMGTLGGVGLRPDALKAAIRGKMNDGEVALADLSSFTGVPSAFESTCKKCKNMRE